ncbi:MAG: serine hydrolase [Pyrinomonadaceae bacterium]|nr:serine hydrolase [Pyrinomonadaceae bacterium]
MNDIAKNAQPCASISSLLAERITAGDFPSAVYVVAERGRMVLADALGYAVQGAVQGTVQGAERKVEPIAATLHTIYDLASLTKPLVTALLCARLIERGELTLNTTIAQLLSEFDQPDKYAVNVRHLLTHTSGLPAWLPLSIISNGDHRRVLEVIAAQALADEPGTRVIYSDLGFITLGQLLERITIMPFIELAHREIFEPLGLMRTFFNPGKSLKHEVAASESEGNAYERGMCADAGHADSSGNWREGLIWGEVHDGNAYFLGGASGHAGLFSTAHETVRIAEQSIAELTKLLRPATCELFHTNMTPDLNEARSFGWQLAATTDSTAGPNLPLESFGHTGFTGTSCWIDAERQRIFVLLTNRTHTHPIPFANINSVRRHFHTLAVAALDRMNPINEQTQ